MVVRMAQLPPSPEIEGDGRYDHWLVLVMLPLAVFQAG